MKVICSFLFLIFLLIGCDIASNKPLPQNQFTIVFENNNNGQDYFPIDIKQTADNGYLILAEVQNTATNFPLVYVMKTDEKGVVEWEKLSESLVSPASELMASGSDFVFVCMDKDNLTAKIIKADNSLTEVASLSTILYPLVAQKVGAGYALLSYYPDDKQTIFTVVNETGSVRLNAKYEVYEDAQQRVFEHITRRGKRLPFSVGDANGGLYYFNGLSNFTQALVFANSSTGEQSGVTNGIRYESAVSALLPLTNGKYAVTLYDIGGNTRFLMQATMATAEVSSINKLEGVALPELIPFAPVKLKKTTLNGKSVCLLNASTKNGQTLLSCYDENSGTFLGSLYYGSGNKTELASVAATADGGLIVLVKTYVSGRYGRIMVYKLTKDQADKLAP